MIDCIGVNKLLYECIITLTRMFGIGSKQKISTQDASLFYIIYSYCLVGPFGINLHYLIFCLVNHDIVKK